MKVYVILMPYGSVDSLVEVHLDKDVAVKRAKELIKDYDPEDYSEGSGFPGIAFYAEYHPDESPILVFERELIR